MVIFGKVVESYSTSALPTLAVLVPLIGAVLVLVLGRFERWRDAAAVAASFITFLLVASIYPLAIAKGQSISYILPKYVFGIGLNFSVDPLSFVFALITSLVWLVATLYSVGYMSHEENRTRYYFFLLIVLASNLGVVVTGDFFSLFIFFEALGLFSYPLVIHSQTGEALRAGTKYMLMNIISGVALLAGILLLYGFTGSYSIAPALGKLQSLSYMKYIIAALLIGGFGVKAGIVPLHIWLPDAHPVAPSPASALLSGIMIKAGAYGILRTVAGVFRPPFLAGEAKEKAIEILWRSSGTLGYYVIWIGVITMFLGVIMALLQENSKRMLAYHSVSQMGYVVMGIGVGAYLGSEGGLGFAGGLYHIVNHALFKAALFLGVGAVYVRTHEYNMYKLGGLWRKMPVTFVFTLIAALGISGIPIFNGFASKTLLHDGIIETFEKSHLASLKWAEIIFLITGGGTFCSLIKMIKFTFLGKMPERFKKTKEVPWTMLVPMGFLAAAIVGLGIYPNLMLDRFLNPIVANWGLPAESLKRFPFFALEPIRGVSYSLTIGFLIFVIGIRYELFHLHFARWVSIDWWYQRLARKVYVMAEKVRIVNDNIELALMKVVPAIMSLRQPVDRVDRLFSRLMFAFFVDMWLVKPVTPRAAESILDHGMTASDKEKNLGSDLEHLATAVSKTAGGVSKLTAGKLERADYRFVDDVAYFGKRLSLTISNIDFAFIDKLIAVTLIVLEWLSVLAGLFDTYVIDGIVNGVGWIVKRTSRGLRPIQTGDVQDYGLVMVAGSIIIIFFFALAFYGAIRVIGGPSP